MPRLNNRAFNILRAELSNCCTNNPLSQAEKQIALKRLERLRQQEGAPVSLEELRETVVDLFPQFSEKALKEAAKANKPPGVFSKVKWVAVLVTGSAGVLWLVNLPYPMIRWPVARTAPILLLPSYLSMDYNYRQAIASVEQADQLINKSTSPEDFERGADIVVKAQKHLDALPVWFLGYWPRYTFWFGWQFTLDEFKVARATVGRMDAQIFQEKNAQDQLEQVEQALNTVKQQYQQAASAADKEKAIAPWQTAIDQLDQIPTETLAGKTAQTRLKADNRDFENARIGTLIAAAHEYDIEAEKIKQKQPQTATQLWQEAINQLNQVPVENPRFLEAQKLFPIYQSKLGGVANSNERSEKLLAGAKAFALAAAQTGQNPPHTVTEWQQVAKLWEKALDQLESISVEDTLYVDAQTLTATYQTNLGIVQTRLQSEETSETLLKNAKQQIQRFIASPPSETNQWNSSLQEIIDQLETIKTGTTTYSEAQQLKQFAQKKLR
jgi:hypothetical protein